MVESLQGIDRGKPQPGIGQHRLQIGRGHSFGELLPRDVDADLDSADTCRAGKGQEIGQGPMGQAGAFQGKRERQATSIQPWAAEER